MHRVNAGYTLLVRVKPDRLAVLAELLAELDADPSRLPFARSKTTHFATLTILPAQRYGDEELPATLLLATSFAGPTRDHLDELVHLLGDPLREVFAHCEGFDPRCSSEVLEDFIVAHRHADTFYSGMQNLAPIDVHRHRALRSAIEKFIDDQQAAGAFGAGSDPVEVRRAIQKYVRSVPDLTWAEASFAPPAGTWLALHGRLLILVPFLAPLLLGTGARVFVHDATLVAAVDFGWLAVLAFVLFLAALVVSVRVSESRQTYTSKRPPDDLARSLAATQNRPVINEVTIAGPIKEGPLRPIFLRIAYWIVARAAEGIPGLMSGINIPTVATARWIAADRGRRLVFISNYTNAAEPYVRDFIDAKGGARNINLVFGFGRGYPRTRWVVKDGALTDPNGFIYVVSEGQRPTAYWYGPYRDLSIDNIKLDRRIREGLFVELDPDPALAKQQAQDWLHLL